MTMEIPPEFLIGKRYQMTMLKNWGHQARELVGDRQRTHLTFRPPKLLELIY